MAARGGLPGPAPDGLVGQRGDAWGEVGMVLPHNSAGGEGLGDERLIFSQTET